MLSLHSFIAGTITIAQLESLKQRYFGNSVNELLKELQEMLDDEKTFASRKHQIKICSNLSQYHDGASVMLQMRDLFDLSGDFSVLEKILQSVINKFNSL